ncbi:MAG: glycosyltransferase family 39 protein [Candidatus Coatesbacteria bacterium]|nr:glycosyltransferase family 39 protein [Candidatus Coatesbacteria bacterium]
MNTQITRGFWVSALVVAAFVVAVFGGTVSIPLAAEDLQVYVNYIFFTSDDLFPEAFYGNGFGILPGEFVYKIGRKPEEVGGVYRPLTASLMALDFAICGVKSTSYHLTNLLLQIACSIAVLALAWQFTRGSLVVSSAAALLFTVNPTHSLTQVALLQRSDILCALFYVFSVLFYARYSDGEGDKGARRDYILCIVFMVLSLMSKEMAATLPIAFFLYDVFVHSENPFRLASLIKLAKRHIIFFAVLIFYLLFRIVAFQGIGGYPGFALAKDTEAPAVLLFGRHNITNTITGLNHLFGVASQSRLVRYSLLAVIFLPILFRTDKRVRYSIIMVPVAMLPILTMPSITPLYMYLSSAFFSVAVAASFYWILERIPRRGVGTAAFALLVILVGTLFSMDVHSDIALFKRRIEFAYVTSDRIAELISPVPKGAKIYLITPTMMESEGRVDFDPAIEAVLRVKVNDHSLKLWPIPVNVERDEQMERFQAAALDMEQIEPDARTYFLDNLSGKLRLRPDVLDRFRSREAVRSVKRRQPGDYYAWVFNQDKLGWTVTDGNGMPIDTELLNDNLVYRVSGTPSFLIAPIRDLNPKRVDRASLSLKVVWPDGPPEFPVILGWTSNTYRNWSREQSRTVMVKNDGEFHEYISEPGKDYHWVTSEGVKRLRIQFPPMSGEVHLKKFAVYYSWVLNP